MSTNRVIDCDVHPLVTPTGRPLDPYLTSAMRRRLGDRIVAATGATPLLASQYPHPSGDLLKPEALTPSGGPPGSDAVHLKEDLLDRYDLAAVVLQSMQGAGASSWRNVAEGTALNAAFNDYFIEHWLSLDERFNLAITVASQDPHGAAAEIRRLADVDGVSAVWVPLLDMLLGHRHYHPIFDAAQEVGLPIVLHPCGSEGTFQGGSSFASGVPTTWAERFADFYQFGIGHISSLLFEGIFERFPKLRFVFLEYGWSWLASMLMRWDETWRVARVEVPWVKRLPSEYVAEHVFTCSQPMEGPRGNRTWVKDMLLHCNARQNLVFSSDYPHWDGDEYTRLTRAIPEDIQREVFFDNAMGLYPKLRLGAEVPA